MLTCAHRTQLAEFNLYCTGRAERNSVPAKRSKDRNLRISLAKACKRPAPWLITHALCSMKKGRVRMPQARNKAPSTLPARACGYLRLQQLPTRRSPRSMLHFLSTQVAGIVSHCIDIPPPLAETVCAEITKLLISPYQLLLRAGMTPSARPCRLLVTCTNRGPATTRSCTSLATACKTSCLLLLGSWPARRQSRTSRSGPESSRRPSSWQRWLQHQPVLLGSAYARRRVGSLKTRTWAAACWKQCMRPNLRIVSVRSQNGVGAPSR